MYLKPTYKPYAFSDLCEFKCLRATDNRKVHPEIIAFQNAFKSSILDSESFQGQGGSLFSTIRMNKIYEMRNKVLSNMAISKLL